MASLLLVDMDRDGPFYVCDKPCNAYLNNYTVSPGQIRDKYFDECYSDMCIITKNSSSIHLINIGSLLCLDMKSTAEFLRH